MNNVLKLKTDNYLQLFDPQKRNHLRAEDYIYSLLSSVVEVRLVLRQAELNGISLKHHPRWLEFKIELDLLLDQLI